MNNLENPRVWLITGCSSGLGHALASAVLARGQRVIATARNPAALSELAAQVQSVLAEANQAFGRIDVVVNNAGYGVVGAFEELSPEQVERNFNTNFFGALEVIRAALPILREQRSGTLVNISAAAAIANYAGFSIYGASKRALEGVCESLAIELRPLGVGVMIVQPGPFRTDFISRSLERPATAIAEYASTSGKFIRFLDSMDGKQPGDPEKAAAAIISAVESGKPPLRLVLGQYACEKAKKLLVAAQRELEQWEEIGKPTDFASP